MNRFHKAALTLGMTLALTLCSLASHAEAKPPKRQSVDRISLNVRALAVTEALQRLFQGTGRSLILQGDLTGTVTVSLRDAPFEHVLVTMLASANPPLACTEIDQVYYVQKRKRGMPLFARETPAPPSGERVTLRLSGVPVQSALKRIFEQAGILSWRMDPPVTGNVSVSLRDASLLEALMSLKMRASGPITFSFPGGEIVVQPSSL